MELRLSWRSWSCIVQLTWCNPMNFYASTEYLESVAEVCFKSKSWAIEDVRIGDEVLRLLVTGGKKPVTKGIFLDYHVPLQPSEIKSPARKGQYATSVARSVIALPDLKERNGFKGLELAPYVDWSLFPTYDDYKAFVLGRNRGLVRERERRGRRLAEAFGEPVFRMHDDRDDVLPLAQEWKSRQLARSGIRNWIADPQVVELLNVLHRKGLLVSSTLRVSERLAAVWIGFIYDGCWSGWIFTHDPELSKYSAGHHLVSAMLEQSYKLNHREFDFSSGDEDYKMIYATHARLLGDIGRAPVTKQLFVRAKEQVKERIPRLFQFAQDLKRELNSRKANSSFWPIKIGQQN